MISNILTRIFGSRNERLLKQYAQALQKINALEPDIAKLSDADLRAKTDELKARVSNGEALDDVLPEAFAVVREAGKRTLAMRHFDVQLIGGMALHYGKIAEMRTGEGKTLVATLARVPQRARRQGRAHRHGQRLPRPARRRLDGAHLQVPRLTVGVNLSQMSHADKQAAYAADITYGTNNEFGFDYLRDNMVFAVSERVQRGLSYAIVDEVDSILIDEARTPLIISGQADDNVEMYYRLNEIAPKLTRQKEEKGPATTGSTRRRTRCSCPRKATSARSRSSARPAHTRGHGAVRHAEHLAHAPPDGRAARACALSPRPALRGAERRGRDRRRVHRAADVGPRWSDGLHQAVEAKEGVPIQKENQTLASITFQNYFRMYGKLAGMTGTADTEAFEFQQIYHLETVVIPTTSR
jgi:preprotein translocase subunit SecA